MGEINRLLIVSSRARKAAAATGFFSKKTTIKNLKFLKRLPY